MVVLVQAIGSKSVMLIIGAVGGIASAYLWVAQDLNASPVSPVLLVLLLALLAMGLLGSLGVICVFYTLSTGGRSGHQDP